MTNSRFEELEQRYNRLRRIFFLKLLSLLFAIFSIVFSYFYYFHTVNQIEVSIIHDNEEKANQITKELIESNESNVSISEVKEEEKKVVDDNTLFLKPKTNFSSSTNLPSEEKISLSPPLTDSLNNTLIEDFLAKPRNKVALKMSVNSLSDEESLLKNFNSSHTFPDALALATYYLNKSEYIKAIKWAKEASNLNPISEQPWIVYAQSKFHLGERKEAIHSLELFLTYANQKEVRELLQTYKGKQ